MKAIKLYSRESHRYKCIDVDECNKIISSEYKDLIVTNIQQPYYNIIKTKRESKPYDLEITFYTLETLKEMINDLIREQDMKKLNLGE